MYFTGLLIGVFCFLIIGLFHPVVIKCEYYFSEKIWPTFLFVGLAALGGSLFIGSTFFSALLSILGFTCLWSIGELKEQKERVRKGWFPANPARKKRTDCKKAEHTNIL